MLWELDNVREGKELVEFCVEYKRCFRGWIKRGKGRERGNCVLTVDLVKVIL